jgi:hypothetical protein
MKITMKRSTTWNKPTNEQNTQFTREVQMANKYMKKSSTSLSIKEMQIKMTLRFYITPIRMAITKNTTAAYAEKKESSYTFGRK